eukprot:TRINITY_DN10784_c0_g1_i2.p1 TRINITY_DN10784_c0_g1~~TRINITY_DN10784_c0_g1_i2.p1  ORF type:complete len:416 (-),score=37.77 TRINITY_DN10784_c0_g1_i2:542-1723(-)
MKLSRQDTSLSSFGASPLAAASGADAGTTGATTGKSAAATQQKELAPPHLESDTVLDSHQKYEIAANTYCKLSAAARGARVHSGPLKLRAALKPADRTAWVREDKKYSPYSYIGSPNDVPTEKQKGRSQPPRLWMPLTTEEHARAEALRAKEAYDRGVDEKEEKEPWDTEHHIKPSQANHEVQVYCREYFDKPKRKEGEGIPKVRELYSMNDRQCGWHDLPNPNSGFRRTHLDWVGRTNKAEVPCATCAAVSGTLLEVAGITSAGPRSSRCRRIGERWPGRRSAASRTCGPPLVACRRLPWSKTSWSDWHRCRPPSPLNSGENGLNMGCQTLWKTFQRTTGPMTTRSRRRGRGSRRSLRSQRLLGTSAGPSRTQRITRVCARATRSTLRVRSS